LKGEINVGMVGYQFMGRAHSNAYRQAPVFFDCQVEPVMKAICGRNKAAVFNAACQLGWESCETDWRTMLGPSDIDMVDISSPGNTHHPIAVAAAKAGKIVFCEKPLANTLTEAREMLKAVQRAKVPNAVCFNYRRAPAVALAKKLVDSGDLGEIYHFRATYLQDWIVDPEFPLVWRLDKKIAGSGAHGDLNAHLIDLAHYLVGEISQVCGAKETFLKERPLPSKVSGGLRKGKGRKRRGRVTVDDAFAFLARFKDGALGTFEATRFATGRKNYNRFEINGSRGSLAFNLERMNELDLFLTSDPAFSQGFRTINVTDPSHPYAANWWPPGHIIGYEHTFVHTVADLLNCIAKGERFRPDFSDGVRCQAVLDAAWRSADSGAWVKVPKV
jgi:predicted dehydrogenase